eukprot:4883384-Prymnesium_polylepis.1
MEGPPNNLVKGTFRFTGSNAPCEKVQKRTNPALLLHSPPTAFWCDFLYPHLKTLVLDTLGDAAKAAAEAAESAQKVAEHTSDLSKKIKGKLEQFKVVGTSKSTYVMNTASMTGLDKAAVLLYILQHRYGAHRASLKGILLPL